MNHKSILYYLRVYIYKIRIYRNKHQ